MSHSFPANRLLEPPFDARLVAVLNEAQTSLGLESLAVSELGAADGRIAPRWRCWTPRSAEPAPLTLDQFEQLATGPATRSAEQARWSGIGRVAAGQSVRVVPLRVQPQLVSGADTLLLAIHGGDPPDPVLIRELTECLEAGLSENRQRRLAEIVFHAVDQAPDPLELTDRQARIVYANLAWERSFGYSLDDVRGRTVGSLFRDRVAPLHDPAFYQFTLATLADGRPWMGALACRTQDGRRVFYEANVAPFSADAQGFRGNLAVRRDLSHRAERDEALAVAHREFRAVLSAIPDGVAVLRDGNIYFANAPFLAMVGLPERTVIGRAYSDFVHEEDRPRFLKEYKDTLTRVRIETSDGALRFVEISTAGEVSFEGKPAMILLSRDTTDYRLAQEQLSRAEKLSALGSLAAGVAHEINNPLAYVQLNLQYIRASGALRGEEGDALKEALGGVERIQNIVSELRTYSGADSGGEAEAVSVRDAVASAVNISQNEIRHRARLEREQLGDQYVLAREGPLVQVLVNVLVNAAQAIPAEDGRDHLIRIVSERVGRDQVEIRISDTGKGIARDAVGRVFEPFSTSKRRGAGSGLGLAISRRIVDEFGGEISLQSELGKGTTVIIRLPRARARQISTPAPQVQRSVSGTAPRAAPARVLIVDDEPAVARSIKRVLSHSQVEIALDAATALRLIEESPPFDVVLCDVMMPGIPGPELYREVSHRRPELASNFIFMTGGAFSDHAREFLETVQAPVLVKPLDLRTVLGFVEQLLRQDENRSVS